MVYTVHEVYEALFYLLRLLRILTNSQCILANSSCPWHLVDSLRVPQEVATLVYCVPKA